MTFNMQTMKSASEYLGIKRGAKVGGRGSIAFGLLAILGGIVGLGSNVLAIPLVGLGLFLLGAGVWAFRSGSAKAMRLESVALWVVAFWNIATGILTIVFSEGEGAIWILIGAWQIYWGIKARRRAVSFDSYLADHDNASSLAELEGIVSGIQKSPVEQSPDLIEFDTASLTAKQHWKARLGNGWAIFVDSGGTEVIVTLPAEVSVAKQGETAIRHRIKAKFVFAKHLAKGTIPQVSLDRFTSWKLAQVV